MELGRRGDALRCARGALGARGYWGVVIRFRSAFGCLFNQSVEDASATVRWLIKTSILLALHSVEHLVAMGLGEYFRAQEDTVRWK